LFFGASSLTKIVKKTAVLHNVKLSIFYPKNTISWACVWWLTRYVVAGENPLQA
jgi:hypothetical protein